MADGTVTIALGSDTGGSVRFAVGASGFWRVHVRAPLPDDEDDAMIDILLAPIDPDVYEYQRRTRDRTPTQIKAALQRLAHALLGP